MIEPIKPITPAEVSQVIPDWVIIGANECINEHWVELDKESHFTQDELMEHVLKYAPEGTKRNTIFRKHWLDIEPIYERAGWKVVYDKPAYCEDYEANFTFTPKKTNR